MSGTERIETGTLLLLLATILALSVGQVLFKLAASNLQLGDPRTFLSLRLFAALIVYAVATLMWLVVLSRMPLSVAFPFYGLTFLAIPVLSALCLGEPLRLSSLIGGVLILAGVAVSARSSLW